MEKYELPLVIFTVLSQMSVGMALLVTWHTWRGGISGKRLHWLVIGLILAVASIAAVLHLAHPMYAYNALRNLEQSWLSREILGATLYGIAVAVSFLNKGNKVSALVTSVLGIILVAIQGMTYAAPAMQAIANGLTMVLFFLTVWILGVAALPLLKLPLMTTLLRQGILLSIVTLLLAPLIWSTGNTTVQMTAQAWFTSPFWLISMLCLIVSLVISLKCTAKTLALFAILLVGALCSRLTFFGDTLSTIVNIGHLY